MYYDDHDPPHIHVEYQGRKAKIGLDGEVVNGSLGSHTAVRLVREWIGLRKDELSRDWELARDREPLIRNHETAFHMQAAVPALTDLSGETEATKQLYGLDAKDPKQAAYARQCLLARRLVERGVRFVELSCLAYNIGGGNGANPWDQHGEVKKGHEAMARQVDQPIAALLADLDQRGLLDDTLVVWAGEFGRTPFSQGSNGRDHNPMGFSVWMAGGGMKGGTVLGSTDEFGYRAVEDVTTVYDLWATVLHQLGIDHEDLTFRHGGRDMRLTDVHGNVMKKIIA
jgi:hypothetical protein